VAADHGRASVEDRGRPRAPLVHGSRLIDDQVVADVSPASVNGMERIDRPDPSGRILFEVRRVRVVQNESPQRLGSAGPAFAAGGVEAQRLVRVPGS